MYGLSVISRVECNVWESINAVVTAIQLNFGVPEGSVLGDLLFITYVIDLCNAGFKIKVTTYVNDTDLSYYGNLF